MEKKPVFDSKKELNKIKKIAKQLTPDIQKIAQGLIADAAFMAEQLEILRNHITEKGWSEEYKNGANQFGKKTSVEAESYIKLQKSYAAVIKQLTDLIPHEPQFNSDAEKEIWDFIK